jgi:SAM-dependent methyltransferase
MPAGQGGDGAGGGGRDGAVPPGARGRPLPPEAAYWDGRYAREGRVWGDGPGELARLAVARLRPHAAAGLEIVDVGAGYGRDSEYLAGELRAHVVGLEPSPAGVAAALRARKAGLDIEFMAGTAETLAADAGHAGRYDVVFASNVYHLLGPAARAGFAAALARLCRRGGLLFLSTLAPSDPQHFAVGTPVPGEERSWTDHVYLHFSTRDELVEDFAAFEVMDLDVRGYEEHNAGGVVHRHVSWFLEGRRP